MITDSTLIPVRNRNNGYTGYSIADMGIWRNFAPGEVKKIRFDELQKLQYQPGGEYTLDNLLVIENAEALNLLNMHVEPEYSYSEKDIEKLLFEGSLDELRDFLDFAPEGAIEIAKGIAVKREIPDVRKRDIISKATGFNITNAINVNHAIDGEEEKGKEEVKERRVVKKETVAGDTSKQRRTTAPQYKIVNQEK